MLHNRDLRPAGEKLLSPGQVGFLNGWGVFSTLRVFDGVLFAYERHYERMRRDAERLHVPLELSQPQLRASLLALVAANQAHNATLRVALVRNTGGIFQDPDSKQASDLVAFTADLADWGEGVHLGYVLNARFSASPFAGTKITSWAENLTWYEQAHQGGFDEAILLNERGQVSECTSANIFVISGHNIFTPPLLTGGCLPGVTRAILLEELCLPQVTISEREIGPSELESCDQVFITSTTRDLLPVLTVEGKPLRQKPAMLELLKQAFCAFRKSYIEAVTRSEKLTMQ